MNFVTIVVIVGLLIAAWYITRDVGEQTDRTLTDTKSNGVSSPFVTDRDPGDETPFA